jgi:hypothetical protein
MKPMHPQARAILHLMHLALSLTEEAIRIIQSNSLPPRNQVRIHPPTPSLKEEEGHKIFNQVFISVNMNF